MAEIHERDALPFLMDLEAATFDAVITDPPYSSGSLHAGGRRATTSIKYNNKEKTYQDFTGDQKDARSYLTWSILWMTEARRVTKPGGVIAVFCDWRQIPTVSDAVQGAGWTWRGVMTWHKPGARYFPKRASHACEFVVWGSAGGMPNDRDAETVEGFVSCKAATRHRKHHQTTKPIPVMAQVVRLCERGGRVLDPFCGSGSTGVASVLSGREFVGNEIAPHYAQTARERIEAAERGEILWSDGTASRAAEVLEPWALAEHLSEAAK